MAFEEDRWRRLVAERLAQILVELVQANITLQAILGAEGTIVSEQDQVNAFAQAAAASLSDIENEYQDIVAELHASRDAGAPLDLSRLDTLKAKLAADAANWHATQATGTAPAQAAAAAGTGPASGAPTGPGPAPVTATAPPPPATTPPVTPGLHAATAPPTPGTAPVASTAPATPSATPAPPVVPGPQPAPGT